MATISVTGNSKQNIVKQHPVLSVFILSFAISWVAVALLQWLAIDAGLSDFAELNRMAETTFELGSIRLFQEINSPNIERDWFNAHKPFRQSSQTVKAFF
jgi:hypothetical protein